ncbi:MAG TPA: hypothetical protein VGE41_00500 [Verrucomicrobiae bacterium]|jgi:hypothetical protein
MKVPPTKGTVGKRSGKDDSQKTKSLANRELQERYYSKHPRRKKVAAPKS